MAKNLVNLVFFGLLTLSTAFKSLPVRRIGVTHGARSMTAMLDALAGLSIATQLNNAPMNPTYMRQSFPVSVVETKQGMYKEYTVERVDDSALDQFRRGYKTAEETEEGKNKYWAILAVLVAGSFVIPMVQYYWYVAEED